MSTADVSLASDLANDIIARRPLFRDNTLPWSAIDALADDEERDLKALAGTDRASLLHKARALAASSFIRSHESEPSPGEFALILSILAALLGG